MSTWHDREIACVFCGATFVVKVASGLHISRLPAIKHQVLRGEFHRFDCPACDRKLEVRQPVIYTDFSRGHWIEVQPLDEIARWRELAPACTASFHRAVERGAPILRERLPTFRVRVVFGYDELREKITLWEANIDDVDIECLKLIALRQDASMFGMDDRLLVCAIEADRLIIDRHRGDAVARVFALSLQRDRSQAARAEVLTALNNPFPDPFVSINRLVGRYSVATAT